MSILSKLTSTLKIIPIKNIYNVHGSAEFHKINEDNIKKNRAAILADTRIMLRLQELF